MSRVPDPATLLDLSQDKVVVLDEDGTFLHLNATALDLLGFEPDELVGTDAFALVHPDDEAALRESFDAIGDGERDPTTPLEYRYATADEGWLWLRTRVHTPAETGLETYVLFSRNVTPEVESRRRLETIAAASADVFWMFSADWTELLFINDAVETVFGLPRVRLEANPRCFLNAIHPEDRPYVERSMQRLSAGESIHLDYRVGTADSPTKWVRVQGEPVIEDDEVVAVTGFARDVTGEYRRKRQLTVMDNLLRHTIRNHMNIVSGTAARIVDDLPDGEDRDGDSRSDRPLDVCVEHAETIRRVANDLLTTAKKQRGVIELLRQPGSPQPVDIETVIADAIATALGGDRHAIELSVSCPSGTRAFTHAELDYAIAELIENTVEHAESTPVVDVDVTVDGGSVEIAVRDNCPPIPAEERHVITDRWEMDKLHHTDGMGLWVVYWIVDRSGGDLEFDTGERGNVVTITVPSADCNEAREGRTEAGRPTMASDGSETTAEETAAKEAVSEGTTAGEPTAERPETNNGTGVETD